MTPTEGFQLAQALASIATVVLVILAWQQIRLVRKQATTTFEDSLTAQYRKIMENIPTDIRGAGQTPSDGLENSRPKCVQN